MNSKLIVALGLILSLNSIAAVDTEKWIVSDGNVTCLIVQMKIKVNFTYETLDNATKTVLYEVPANATVDKTGSKCSEKVDTLKASWGNGNGFVMDFTSNTTKYDLTSFVVNLNTSNIFNDSAVNQTNTIQYTFASESYDIPSNFSYHCNREQRLNGTDGSYFIVSKVQFEAFRHDNSDKFAAAKDCDSNITPDIVPIAVGISLIALIVVVLIAYIVGRRRQQARGYLNIM